MPRPLDAASSPAPPSTAPMRDGAASASGSFLCDRIQQFRQRMRSRCMESRRFQTTEASGTVGTGEADAPMPLSLPCLLQSWRKRIENMEPDDDDAVRGRGHHHSHHLRHCGRHRRACHQSSDASSSSSSGTAASETESDEQGPAPSAARAPFPFCAPRLLHPRLERQQAVCSLSGIWSGFSSSPPPSPEIYAKTIPRHRRHPYSRCFRRGEPSGEALAPPSSDGGASRADDHGKSP